MNLSPIIPPRLTPPPPLGNRVGRKMKTGGFLSRTRLSVRQYLVSLAQDGLLVNDVGITDFTTTVVVPAASNTPTPATIAVFAFVYAIILKAPLMRVKVEVEAAAPLASATAVTDFASAAGAA